MTRAKRVAGNNNRGSVRSLALRSVKSSRMRNFFVVLTILLSVSLLMVIALFYAGMNTERKRQVERMQHAVYYRQDETQLVKMAEDERSSYILGMKQGQAVEIDGNMVQPVAYMEAPLKSEGVEIDTVTPSKGEIPREKDEVMLSDAYCKLAGITAKPGEKVTFTWLDGTTEEYTVSGIFHTAENLPMYSVLFPEQYAREGSQLKELPWDAIVCFQGADEMSQPEFEDLVYGFGADHGTARENMNINNFFLDVLPGGDMQTQQTILIIGVGIALLFVSVLVIYSVFYLSVVGRIRQFGQLRTIGMTKRQIRRMVRMEGLLLSAVGIPLGLLIGGAVSYFIRPGGWSWMNVLVIGAAVTAADIVTVLLSIQKPARYASAISPVEAAKYSGYADAEAGAGCLKPNKAGKFTRNNTGKPVPNSVGKSTPKLSRKITPGSLAVMSNARNKKKTVLTMISLGIGGVLFMLAAFFISCTDLEGYARQGYFEFGEFAISYSYNVAETAEHGTTQLKAEHPLDEALIDELKAIDGVEKIYQVENLDIEWEAHGTGDGGNVKGVSRERFEKIKGLLMEGTVSYSELAEKDGVIFTRGNAWEEAYGWEFQVGDTVDISWYDGEQTQEKSFTVMGIIDANDFTIQPGDVFTDFILPEESFASMGKELNLNEDLVLEVDREKEADIERSLDDVLGAYPWLSMDTLREQELQSRESFTIVFSTLLGLSVFIIGFALINLLNTLITNILTRRHEFAMLQSVGMTRKQLSKMLRTEGLLLAAGNLVITTVLGTAAGYAMVEILQYFHVKYMHFVFPIWFYLGYAVFILLIPVAVTECMVRRFQRESLVERLRE